MTQGQEVLRIEALTKSYPVYSSTFMRFMRWLGYPSKPISNFVAVDNISLSINKGETIGLIGQNGAGKSTLLKLITGTVRPNSGTVHAAGKISAILELGLGFNPEFTGRENVLHSGSMFGFSPEQLDEMMPDIESFAEIGEYFDQQVRTYSSGMQARLAFALATATQPEILIVDEVLSVGDAYFQHKSFSRIKEFREKGSTIIIVSHTLGDIRELCDRVILLNNGKIEKQGLPDEVIDYYNAITAERENKDLTIEQRRQKNGWLHTEFGNGRAKMESIDLFDAATNSPVQMARTGQELEIRTRISVLENLSQLVIGHRITDRTGHVIWGSNTWHRQKTEQDLIAGETLECTLKFVCNLGPGSYAIHFGLHREDTHLGDCYHKAENQIVFEVVNADQPHFIGSNSLPSEFSIRRVGEHSN